MSAETITYLTSLQAVRDRSRAVLAAAKANTLTNFIYHPDKLSTAADYVSSIIDRDFGPANYSSIPPHGRWQHFNVGDIDRITPLIATWEADGLDKLEVTRRLVDLFLVSVLLDAGAGDVWTFTEPGTGNVYNRSEGIAVASLYMVKSGAFSSDGTATVDAPSLQSFTETSFNTHFQINPTNHMVGVPSRVSLLNSVGTSLLANSKIFTTPRPGALVDYISSTTPGTLNYAVLWRTLQTLLLPVWPKTRTQVAGQPVGDAWPLELLTKEGQEVGGEIQPFHKLTQWLGYSLTVPFVRVLGYETKNTELGTGLPEYRNGGLFVDLGVLTLKEDVLVSGLKASSTEGLPLYDATGDVIVEWRALTVALLDEVYGIVKAKYAEKGVELSMAQMLEAGSWKGGRELAAKYRPETKSSPILIVGDGTLF